MNELGLALSWCFSNIFTARSHYHPAVQAACDKPDAIKPLRLQAHPDSLLPGLPGTCDA